MQGVHDKVRFITLWSMKFNVRVFATHIKSEENGPADLLSRGKVSEYLCGKHGEGKPEQEMLAPELWPLPVTWLN